MTTHTPGPWVQFGDASTGLLVVMPAMRQGAIATIEHDVPEDQHAANARLIAAAPDLLAALQELLKVYVGNDKLNTPVVQQARAAIARADLPKPEAK